MMRSLKAGARALIAAAMVAASAAAAAAVSEAPRVLRVCADPNNLPYSNEAREGFENRIAETIAADLGAKLEYTWWAQRRGFARNTLQSGRCDLVVGVPAHYELARTTRPYYRSGYMFVTRADRHLNIESLDDPALRRLRIGIHLIGPDQAPPPALALTERGIVDNVVGYSIYGDYREPDPPMRLLEAVASGEIDVAIAWGPFAGYAVRRQGGVLRMSPVPSVGGAPFRFSIAMGVRKGDAALRSALDHILDRRASDIRALLESYGVPVLPEPEAAQ